MPAARHLGSAANTRCARGRVNRTAATGLNHHGHPRPRHRTAAIRAARRAQDRRSTSTPAPYGSRPDTVATASCADPKTAVGLRILPLPQPPLTSCAPIANGRTANAPPPSNGSAGALWPERSTPTSPRQHPGHDRGREADPADPRQRPPQQLDGAGGPDLDDVRPRHRRRCAKRRSARSRRWATDGLTTRTSCSILNQTVDEWERINDTVCARHSTTSHRGRPDRER